MVYFVPIKLRPFRGGIVRTKYELFEMPGRYYSA